MIEDSGQAPSNIESGIIMNTTHADAPEAISHPPIPQEAFDWYDEYAHGIIDRRTFMNRLATLTAAGFSMSVLLGTLMPNYAHAEQVSFNDPAIKARYVVFPSPKRTRRRSRLPRHAHGGERQGSRRSSWCMRTAA